MDDSVLRQSLAKWERLQDEGGSRGVRASADECFARAGQQRTWSAIDECIALDVYASIMDATVTHALGEPPGAYFQPRERQIRWRRVLDLMPGASADISKRVLAVEDRAVAMWRELERPAPSDR